MKVLSALFLIFAVEAALSIKAPAQAPSAIGQWTIEISFVDGSRHSLRFDAQGSGNGSFLLLDSRSSLIEPAQPTPASWAQVSVNQIDFSGAVEFPIGNVGREPGLLVFKGTFETADTISGQVEFFHFAADSKDPEPKPARSGTFRGTRVSSPTPPTVQPPSVQLLSPTSGKLKRGREVDIFWQNDSKSPIVSQQVFLSLDNGETFSPISSNMNGATTELAWVVPESLPNTKKARLMIVVVDATGQTAQDTSKETFKIR